MSVLAVPSAASASVTSASASATATSSSAGAAGLVGLPEGFLAPERLWLLLLVPALAVAYVLLQRRRRRYALRFSALAMLGQVAPRRPGWRRHVAAAGLLLTAAAAVVGFARPVDDVQVPRERATVVVAVDVSLSMRATDVEPSRLAAAQAAADSFVADLPPRLNVGLVAFAGSGQVLVPPTTDRAAVQRGIDSLRLMSYTGIGEGIYASLAAVEEAPADPQDPTSPVPAAVVLLSDGETTVGRRNVDAAEAAARAGVPVSTIAFGTPGGSIVTGGVETPVPVNEQDLQQVADLTGGRAYQAQSAGELEDVYADIGSSIGYETSREEVTARWTGITLVLLLLTSAGSLLWFGRLP